ncbi:MAG: MipA/OmpV family protein [Proteobacteria bacterium]|nr:MipA/OmpV family protein [Pseudomonadota bacterium]
MGSYKASSLSIAVLFVLLVLACSPHKAHAGDGWDFTLGGGIFRANVYSGSNDYYVVPAPVVRVSYGMGDVSFSLSLPEGLGISYFNQEKGLIGSLTVGLNGEERDSQEYSVLGIVKDHSPRTKKLLLDTPTASAPVSYDAAIGFQALKGMIGGSIRYYPTSLDYQLVGQEDTDYQGLLYSLFYSTNRSLTEKLSFSAMLGVEYMNQDYADAWYTVLFPTVELDAFDADAGLRDAMFSLQVSRAFSEKVEVSLLVAGNLLLADAGKSPYTVERFQPSTLIYAVYKF